MSHTTFSNVYLFICLFIYFNSDACLTRRLCAIAAPYLEGVLGRRDTGCGPHSSEFLSNAKVEYHGSRAHLWILFSFFTEDTVTLLMCAVAEA